MEPDRKIVFAGLSPEQSSENRVRWAQLNKRLRGCYDGARENRIFQGSVVVHYDSHSANPSQGVSAASRVSRTIFNEESFIEDSSLHSTPLWKRLLTRIFVHLRTRDQADGISLIGYACKTFCTTRQGLSPKLSFGEIETSNLEANVTSY